MMIPTPNQVFALYERGEIEREDILLEKLRAYFDHARHLMCDEEAGLFFRDAKYVYQEHKSANGGKDFWARGNGWGLRNQVLDAAEYGPVARKGWDFLTRTALQEDGTVGYIQPIGERAIPGQVVDSRSTADFGVGAFLMAAAELARFVETR